MSEERFSEEEMIEGTKRLTDVLGQTVDDEPAPFVVNACGNIIMAAASHQSSDNKALIARGLASMAQDLVSQINKEAGVKTHVS